MSLACMEARQRMQARGAGLSEADRLRLEDHTGSCEACRAQSVALSSLVALAHSTVPTLSEVARQRTIANALVYAAREDVIEQPVNQRSVPLPWAWRASFGGVALAAVVALGFVFGRSESATAPSVAGVASVVAPSVVQRFSAEQARHVVVDGAELSLEAGTVLDWDARVAHVTLHSGRVRARVASRQGKPAFWVIAPEFRVVVIGTDFEVGLGDVVVHEGVVRVEGRDGRVLHAGLRATQRWPATQAPAASAVQASGVQASEQTSEQAALRPRESKLNVAQGLALARTRLSLGDLTGARAAVAQTLRARASRVERAEAETLLAESFQVEGKLGPAIAQYQAVARAYRDLGAGDNAAYAASRLTLMRGDRVRALELFRQYLIEHPAGRFRDEAQRAVAQLEASRHGAVDR